MAYYKSNLSSGLEYLKAISWILKLKLKKSYLQWLDNLDNPNYAQGEYMTTLAKAITFFSGALGKTLVPKSRRFQTENAYKYFIVFLNEHED